MADERAKIAGSIDALTVLDGSSRQIDTSIRPDVVEQVGAHIAQALRADPPEAIGCWLNADDAVLAHVVAACLGVPVLRIEEDLGLLEFVPDRRPGVTRAAIVSTMWTHAGQPAKLVSAMRNRGIDVTAVVSLLPDAPKSPEGIRRIMLAQPDANAEVQTR